MKWLWTFLLTIAVLAVPKSGLWLIDFWLIGWLSNSSDKQFRLELENWRDVQAGGEVADSKSVVTSLSEMETSRD